MKTGLLDYIFTQIDINALDRQDVKEYLAYLNEIISKNMSAADKVKFLKCKVNLNNRLIELDALDVNRE